MPIGSDQSPPGGCTAPDLGEMPRQLGDHLLALLSIQRLQGGSNLAVQQPALHARVF